MAGYAFDGKYFSEYPSNKKIAEVRGPDLVAYPSYRKVAVVRGGEIHEYPSNRKLASVKGDAITEYPSGRKIGNLKDIAKSVRKAQENMSLAAFWLCFMR